MHKISPWEKREIIVKNKIQFTNNILSSKKRGVINLSGTETSIVVPEEGIHTLVTRAFYVKTMLLFHKMTTVKLAKNLLQLLLRFGWVIRWTQGASYATAEEVKFDNSWAMDYKKTGKHPKMDNKDSF